MRPWISRHLGTLVVGGHRARRPDGLVGDRRPGDHRQGHQERLGHHQGRQGRHASRPPTWRRRRGTHLAGRAGFLGSACHVPGGDNGNVAMHRGPPRRDHADLPDAAGVRTRHRRGRRRVPAVAGVQRPRGRRSTRQPPRSSATTSTTTATPSRTTGTTPSTSTATARASLQGDCDDIRRRRQVRRARTRSATALDNNCDGVDGIASSRRAPPGQHDRQRHPAA